MFTYRGKSKSWSFASVDCYKENESWFVCTDIFFLRNPWLQQKEGGIFLTIEEHGLRCERQLGGKMAVISHVLFLSNLAISGLNFFFFFFLAAHRIQGNCYFFLENMSNAYKVFPPQCWPIFMKIWLFFPGKETEFTTKKIQIQLCFVCSRNIHTLAWFNMWV